ncbi:MAG: AAA family ATPase [Acidaminobacter sp.]|uniref:ATP-binding protein n=1 Tax=Acidaminobacter sp. TaxID=1872102 RepID=UPI00137DF18F|nr:ATP-binding protein [Acidaminobacter sp.]MZQ97684.1 AAA family ATPase [Acidaminobacter sp.]
MLPKTESLIVEFKSDRNKISDTEIVETIVGFANTQGGKLYIGIEDDGTVSGLNQSRKNLSGLAALIANHTVPPQSVRVEMIEAPRNVMIVEVPASPSIVGTASGKVLRRRLKADGTPETIPMYPHEYVTRLSGLRLLDYSAQVILDSSYNDLDPLERQRLRDIIHMYRGESALLDLNDEELDLALQFVRIVDNKPVPTVCGLLVIGKAESLRKLMPTSGLAFQVLRDTEVRVNEVIDKPILATFEIVQDYMKAWNPEQETEIGLFRIGIPDFDHRAFREAIVNAFSHRDYSLLHRIRIQIDDDGMSINSPGSFVEGVTLDNLLTAEPRSRNPVLADALKRIGLAERTGRGIDRIFEGSLLYGRPMPDYSGSDATNVRLFIPKTNPDKAFTKMIAEAMHNKQIRLNVFAMMILSYLRNEKRATINQIELNVGFEKARVRASLERLVEYGYIEASGAGKGRTYLLSSKVYHKLNESIHYVRQTDIDKIRYPELIKKLAREKKEVTRSDVMELLHLTAPQAYHILKRMVEDGILEMTGTKRNAAYHMVSKEY